MATTTRPEPTIESLLESFSRPDAFLRALIAKAARIKDRQPKEWGRIAAVVFGLSTKKGADLLMPHAVAVQARHLNIYVKGRYALNEERTLWL